MKNKYITAIPLALLALSASYGIFEFSKLFVPWYVAGITAMAFELTYISLAFIPGNKVKPVSIMAVITSILWNVAHSWVVLYPQVYEILSGRLWFSLLLAILHGVPLALLAYLVADVSIHQQDSKPTKRKYTKKKGANNNGTDR